MSASLNAKQIWLVYDGECPLCRNTAMAVRIQKQYGTMHLLNARENAGHPVVLRINELGYDLDDGMIVFDGQTFFHGPHALYFMSKFADTQDLFNISNKILFRSKTITHLLYPLLRGLRNQLLKYKKIRKIRNLKPDKEAIFQSVFGNSWGKLPIVIQKHYANRPYSHDITTVHGQLDVWCCKAIQILAPVFWAIKNIPPRCEHNVPVTVCFTSDLDSPFFHFKRTFQFANRTPYQFQSKMLQLKNNDVVEMMAFRIGWRMNYVWEDNKVQLKHRGYVFNAFGYYIPMPLTWLVGQGYAEEIAIDENTFEMKMTITHPLWGKMYEYKGIFVISTGSDPS